MPILALVARESVPSWGTTLGTIDDVATLNYLQAMNEIWSAAFTTTTTLAGGSSRSLVL
jgi:hypothetical protein